MCDISPRYHRYIARTKSDIQRLSFALLLHNTVPLSKELIKEANSIIYGFIWNGKDKVKRHALISDIKNGGLRMLGIESLIKAKRVMSLKKFLQDYPSLGKTILGKILSPVGGRFLLYCNFDMAKLKTSSPAYYKECLDAWSKLNRKTPSSSHEVINEIIWNNRFICIDKIARIKLIYRIELQIAREKNKLSQHFIKWRKLVEVLT